VQEILPVGKLPPELLARLLAQAETLGAGTGRDKRVVLGPALGIDCAVIDLGETLLVLKSDPITFAADEIGWYAVQVNANDIATTGGTPRWMLFTLLLPENQGTAELVEQIGAQVFNACREIGVVVVGGHTEITYGLDRPVIAATMIGDVVRERLVMPAGCQAGDRILLTKGVPVEATALLARELPDRLGKSLSAEQIEQARQFLFQPGISVLRDAQVALSAGQVHAMHDPTEGGLYTAAWELAQASGRSLWIDPNRVPVPEIARLVCAELGIDPLSAIASGALLLACPAEQAGKICSALEEASIACAEIGQVIAYPPGASPGAYMRMPSGDLAPLPRPARDAITSLFL
jgi:hydrogenase maturation factor